MSDVNRISSAPLSKVSSPKEVEQYMIDNARNDETDSIDSLAANIDLEKKQIPGFNQPTLENAEFPEEYEVETRTGLVKVATLQKLNRLDTRVTTHSSKRKSSGLDEDKLKKRIEQNQKEIDAYHKSSGIKKFFGKLFG